MKVGARHKYPSTSAAREAGQAVIEFALASLVFFVLVGGVVDLSRAVWYQSTMQEAVQEATRYAVVHGVNSTNPVGPTDATYSAGPPSTDSTLTNIVDKYAKGLNTSSLTVNSIWPDGDNADNHRVTVKASYPFNPFTAFFGGINITLTASSTRSIVN
jgi:Flp pilus assembly protein TadG